MSQEVGMRLLVATATYNELDNLPRLVTGIRHHVPTADVLVIDDNSPDGTGKLADALAGQHAWLHVLHRSGKQGLGTALLAAMRYAMAQDYDLVVTMDADGSHAPCALPDLVAGMRQHDVMIGSRYIRGGGTINWPASRLWMSMAVNLLVRTLMRLPAKDCSGGYRCFRVAKLRQAQLDRMLSHGYSFQQEVLYRCQRVGCRIGETPILFENRKVGVSKVNRHEAIRSLAMLLSLGVKAFFGLDGRGY